MSKKTIADADVAGKTVLMRVDFNVPVTDGVIDDDRRIRLAEPSIRSVLERGGRLALLSHRGRPTGDGFEAALSLRPCAARLSEILGEDVAFPSTDCLDDAARDGVASLADGQAALLENLRFHKAEKTGDDAMAGRLAALGDVYCNEAFGTSHRSDTSMVALPRAMHGKPRVAGMLLLREIKFLSESLADPERPFTAVLGGAKVADKIPAIEHLIPRTDHIIIGGAMAYTFLAAAGVSVGASRVEQERLAEAKRMMEMAEQAGCALHLPEDHVCASEFSESPSSVQTHVGAIPDGAMGLDIGPATADRFASIIGESKTVIWNGPMGVFEWAKFQEGTRRLAESIAEATQHSGALTIVGGGDTASAAERFGVAQKVSHVSTGGGASLEMLSGKRFESIELLDEEPVVV